MDAILQSVLKNPRVADDGHQRHLRRFYDIGRGRGGWDGLVVLAEGIDVGGDGVFDVLADLVGGVAGSGAAGEVGDVGGVAAVRGFSFRPDVGEERSTAISPQSLQMP